MPRGPKPVPTVGMQRAAELALSAMDDLRALAEEGDPRYATWWHKVEQAARELAHQAALVKHGLRQDSRRQRDAINGRSAPEVQAAAERLPAAPQLRRGGGL